MASAVRVASATILSLGVRWRWMGSLLWLFMNHVVARAELAISIRNSLCGRKPVE